ncbi:hypothetical protein MSIMFB_01760 [Mycobacterium simulans]|uniref:Uncharacterized protein n=1 Tax=Mycobacterium simulans TaxID=627089 RepID=A0A7Z7N9X5_9MYCO|nr:PE domain-containing protein [Mycobacterium simulans]SOJ54261.1 hypothetical protein MSIMFB_01760 [Mycobacterium simulans]
MTFLATQPQLMEGAAAKAAGIRMAITEANALVAGNIAEDFLGKI